MKNLNSVFMLAVKDILPYPVKYEGKLFSPPVDHPWLEVKVIPSLNNPLQTVERVGGILQIDINHPLDVGSPKILEDADTVKARLKPHAYFEHNGQSFFVRKSEISQILTKGNYHVIHVSVSYRAVINI